MSQKRISISRVTLLVCWVLLCDGSAAAEDTARTVVQLTDGWRFQIDVDDLGEKDGWYRAEFDRAGWGLIEVPKAWDLHELALWGFEGLGWYAFDISGALARPRYVQRLEFGRVNYHSKVWLNGELLGENINGWLPFEFNVSGKLRPDRVNHLVIRVDNRPRPQWLPGARRIEWVQYGGILQPVELVTTGQVRISDMTIESSTPTIKCTVDVLAEVDEEVTLRLQCDSETTSTKLRPGPKKPAKAVLSMSLPNARLWSPESPTLYALSATVETNSVVIDRVVQKFGIRRVETAGRRILLNGKPLRIRGVNRYDEYAPYGPNAPRNLVIGDLKAMKSAGINTVRVHYPQAADLISLYDEMGFLMIEELPINWWDLHPEGTDGPENDILPVAMPALERMIQRDKNHPSVAIWSMANESPTDTPTGIRTMRALMRRTRELDPTRLVTFVCSQGDVSRHMAYADADLVAANMYSGTLHGQIARHTSEIDHLVYRPSLEYLRRSLATFPDKPLLVTEFGTRGIRGIRADAPYSEDFQAASIRAAWRAIRESEDVAGGVLWSWADYYHRRDFIQYAPFGPYGVVTVDRKPKAALAALQEMFSEK
jgi:beta-glucuronidase